MKLSKKISILCFAIILVLPNVLMLLNFNDLFSLNEKKGKKLFPELTPNLITFGKGFKDYYNSNFGLKNVSFVAYKFFKVDILNENPLPNRTVKGKKGWCFLGDFGRNVFSNNVGIKKITPQEEKLFKKNILQFFEKSEILKIPFYYLVSPDKHQIYNEFLPFNISKNESKFEKPLKDLALKNPKVILLNEGLKKIKKQKQLYHKVDSHWNDYGAFHGFNLLLNKLKKDFPVIEILKTENFSENQKTVTHQDLANMIDSDVEEKVIVLREKNKIEINIIDEFVADQKIIRHKNVTKPLKIIVFHDSFTYPLVKYFQTTFGETIFAKGMIPNYELIAKEKPDFVILQMVNRKIEILCQKTLF